MEVSEEECSWQVGLSTLRSSVKQPEAVKLRQLQHSKASTVFVNQWAASGEK